MSDKFQQCIEYIINAQNLKGTSLIATIYGDSVLHRGGSMSLGSLITMMALFGFNERAVRTAIFRLVKKNWLSSEKLGRVSYYKITPTSHQLYLQAEKRIYSNQLQEWDGSWCLVLLDNLSTKKRAILKKELGWLGYASISTNVMAYPRSQDTGLTNLLTQYNTTDDVVVFNSQVTPLAFSMNSQKLLEKSWNIDAIRVNYTNYLDNFREIASLLSQYEPTVQQAFQIRTLLIHHYRRAILKDPDLPLELLPIDWPFVHACNLTANIYKTTYELADQYFLSVARTAEGYLPTCAPAFNKRFSDLPFGVYE